MIPLHQSSGTLSFSHMVLNKSLRAFTVVSVSALRRSAVRLSIPPGHSLSQSFDITPVSVSKCRESRVESKMSRVERNLKNVLE